MTANPSATNPAQPSLQPNLEAVLKTLNNPGIEAYLATLAPRERGMARTQIAAINVLQIYCAGELDSGVESDELIMNLALIFNGMARSALTSEDMLTGTVSHHGVEAMRIALAAIDNGHRPDHTFKGPIVMQTPTHRA